MKRIFAVIAFILIAICVIQLWPYKRQVLFHFFEHRRKPEKIALSELKSGRILLRYPKSSFADSTAQALATKLNTNLANAERDVGFELKSTLQVYLFADWEQKGNVSGDIRIAHADPGDNAVYCIVNETWNGIAERPEYQVLLAKRSKPFHPELLEYSAAALSGVWFGKRLDEWANFLISRNLNPGFPLYVSDQQSSRFIRYPWGAIFLRFLKQQYGTHAMMEFYKNEKLPFDARTRWQKWLASITPAPSKRIPFVTEFQKGMTYAYWNSYDGGYPTAKSDRSLQKLQSVGVHWIASVPYGYMRSNSGEIIGYAGHHIAGESDESLWALSEKARSRGLKVMLKPQLWIHHDSWPGKIDFQTNVEWNAWMNSYEKWILHYAIIAELTQADLFCIGTELVNATLKNPHRWRALIERVREIYHGPITYAANWGKEFEGIAFWDTLDYMGVDNYYPVRSSDAEGIAAMKAGFARQKELLARFAVRYRKPILFTEIGYMANSKAGMGPKEYDAPESDYNESLQEACYRIALETYWNEPWFAGMYWWKWFSMPEDAGRTADPHSPHGRLSEKVLREWYAKPKSMGEYAP